MIRDWLLVCYDKRLATGADTPKMLQNSRFSRAWWNQSSRNWIGHIKSCCKFYLAILGSSVRFPSFPMGLLCIGWI